MYTSHYRIHIVIADCSQGRSFFDLVAYLYRKNSLAENKRGRNRSRFSTPCVFGLGAVIFICGAVKWSRLILAFCIIFQSCNFQRWLSV